MSYVNILKAITFVKIFDGGKCYMWSGTVNQIEVFRFRFTSN